MKKFFILISLVIVVACNQNALFLKGAVKTAVRAPITAIKGINNYVTGNTYSHYEKETQNYLTAKPLDFPMVCSDLSEGTSAITSMDEILGGIKSQVCECKLWGSCTKDLCECDVLCPRNLKILDRPEMSGLASALTINSLPFVNSRDDFKDSAYELTQGYCWGHTAVTQRFNRLAFFKPEQTVDFPEDSEDWVNYYESVVNEVLAHKATNIPGFKDLHSFSSHPAIQEILKKRVAEVWSDHAVTIPSFLTAVRTSPYKKEEIDRFYQDVTKKIDYGQKPQIIFTYEGDAFRSHVVMVNSYMYDENGEMFFCIEDGNYPPYLNSTCSNQMYVGSDGKLIYNDSYITAAKVTHNEDSEALQQMHSLADYCLEEKDCPLVAN